MQVYKIFANAFTKKDAFLLRVTKVTFGLGKLRDG